MSGNFIVNKDNKIVVNEVSNGGRLIINEGRYTDKTSDIDYNAVNETLQALLKFREDADFSNVFGANSEKAQEAINAISESTVDKRAPQVVRGHIEALNDLAIGASGGVISKLIFDLLQNLASY